MKVPNVQVPVNVMLELARAYNDWPLPLKSGISIRMIQQLESKAYRKQKEWVKVQRKGVIERLQNQGYNLSELELDSPYNFPTGDL